MGTAPNPYSCTRIKEVRSQGIHGTCAPQHSAEALQRLQLHLPAGKTHRRHKGRNMWFNPLSPQRALWTPFAQREYMSKVLTALRDVSAWGRCGACVSKVWESADLPAPSQQYPGTSSLNSPQPPPMMMFLSVHNELPHQRFYLITMVVCRCMCWCAGQQYSCIPRSTALPYKHLCLITMVVCRCMCWHAGRLARPQLPATLAFLSVCLSLNKLPYQGPCLVTAVVCWCKLNYFKVSL